MKKILTAIAVLTVSGFAAAQSSVTIFGVIDAGVGSIKSSGSGHVTGLLNGGNSNSRIGFRGTEDLGGGLAASFWLEGALNNDVGAGATQTTGLDFQRRSTVSLSGSFGEVRLGRDFVTTYPTSFTFDAAGGRGLEQIELYGVTGAGISTASAFRTSNSVSYFLPASIRGFYGQVQYAFGEHGSSTPVIANASGISSSTSNATTSKTGNSVGGRFGYTSGALDVGVAYMNYANAVRTVGAASYADDYRVTAMGASYDFGVIKPLVFFQTDRIDGRAAIAKYQLDTYGLGATAPLGAGLLRVQSSYYNVGNSSNDANKFAVGYIYNLSKRTVLYADIARINNKAAATFSFAGVGGLTASAPAPGGGQTGFAIGVKHAF